MTAESIKDNVKLVVLIIKPKNLSKIMKIIRNFNPNAFISIEQVKSVKGGDFPPRKKIHWDLLRRKKIK